MAKTTPARWWRDYDWETQIWDENNRWENAQKSGWPQPARIRYNCGVNGIYVEVRNDGSALFMCLTTYAKIVMPRGGRLLEGVLRRAVDQQLRIQRFEPLLKHLRRRLDQRDQNRGLGDERFNGYANAIDDALDWIWHGGDDG